MGKSPFSMGKSTISMAIKSMDLDSACHPGPWMSYCAPRCGAESNGSRSLEAPNPYEASPWPYSTGIDK